MPHFRRSMPRPVSLSPQGAVIEVTDPLTPRTNIMLHLEAEVGEEGAPEGYAKVMHPLDNQENQYLIHFTSVSPKLKIRLHRLINRVRNS